MTEQLKTKKCIYCERVDCICEVDDFEFEDEEVWGEEDE